MLNHKKKVMYLSSDIRYVFFHRYRQTAGTYAQKAEQIDSSCRMS